MKIPDKAKQSVKQMQVHLRGKGLHLTEEQVFQKLVEYEMIDVFGNPTPFALENGYVETI